MPATIMIIRHGEKPPPPGVNPGGETDKKSLSVQGWVRAGALAAWLAPPTGPAAGLAVPDVIYASGPDGPSLRPLQTVAPLAEKLGLKLETAFTKGDEKALAADVLTQHGTVLICWQYQKIPDIVRHLEGPAVPQTWPDDRFDVVWVLTRTAKDAPWRFRQVPERLLAGDREDPIA